MAKQLRGMFAGVEIEKFEVFNWTDPANGQVKPIKSLKVLMSHGDGTVTRESISLPPNMPDPQLKEKQLYMVPVTVSFNKKRQQVSFTLRSDIAPFIAPEVD
jgi:hypothetical protein